MFNKEFSVMLYVDDVKKEKDFFKNIGFIIFNENIINGYETFDMKTNDFSTVTLTVYSNEFILLVSSEVLGYKPSVLFESNDIESLHKLVSKYSDTVGEISYEPFPNFNFKTPNGLFFAVRGK